MTQHTSSDLAVMAGKTSSLKTLKNGTIRLAIDVDEEHQDTATHFFKAPDILVAVARLNPEVTHAKPPTAMPYAAQAEALLHSAFFRTPKVWQAAFNNTEFLQWLRQQPCAYCERKATTLNPNEIAHIGVGGNFKPPYSAIALCHDHWLLKKARGHSALGSRGWFEDMCLDYLHDFTSTTLLKQFKKRDWAQINPHELKVWAMSKQVASYLPAPYGLAQKEKINAKKEIHSRKKIS